MNSLKAKGRDKSCTMVHRDNRRVVPVNAGVADNDELHG